MKRIFIFLLILAGCGSKGALHDVEFFCVDQSNSAVAGAKLKFNGEEKQADDKGRCRFQIPRSRLNAAIPLIAEKADYKFIGPKSINLKEDNLRQHILNFFQGYRMSFQVSKTINESQSSPYSNVAIFLNHIPLGRTDEDGLLDTLIFEELDSSLSFIARTPSNEKKQKMERWEWGEFYYPVKFVFASQKDQEQKQQDYPINILFRTYQQSNNKKESLADIAIFMDATKIGITDHNGRLEHRMLIHYPGEQKRFEAKWDLDTEVAAVKFSDINRTYLCEFIFKKTIAADKVKKLEPETKTIKAWKYDPTYKPPPLILGNRKHFIFLEGKYEEPCYMSPDEKVGDVFNRIVNFTCDNFSINQVKLRKYSEPFQKLIEYSIAFKSKNYTEKDLLDQQLLTTWYFTVIREDGTHEVIDPNLSLKENGIKENDVIIIKHKL